MPRVKISIPSHYTGYKLRYPPREHYFFIRVQNHIHRHGGKYRWLTFVVFVASVFLNVALFDTWKDRQYIAPGKVACDFPPMDYFEFCSPLHDGRACTHETRSRVMAYVDEMGEHCRFKVPDRVFRFVTASNEPQPAPALE